MITKVTITNDDGTTQDFAPIVAEVTPEVAPEVPPTDETVVGS